MTATRQVSWGDALVVELFKTPGGLKAAVDRITEEVGVTAGTRNTFGKLLRVDDPATLAERDQWRAWLLLAALGQAPGEWGISDRVVPRSVDLHALRQRLESVRREGLEPPTRCFVGIGRVGRIRRKRKPSILPEYDDRTAYATSFAA